MEDNLQVIAEPTANRREAAQGHAAGGPRRAITPRRRGADYYDTILWRLLPASLADAEGGAAIGVTSGAERSGVSTVAANLAIRAADHLGGPVLLIDANLARPRLARAFRTHRAKGLGDILAGACEPADAIHETGVDGLSLLPAGAAALSDRLSIDQQTIDSLLKELVDEYRLVFVDLPTVAKLRKSLLLARRLDEVLLVVRSESQRRQGAQTALARLRDDGVRVAGAVVTQQRDYIPRWFRSWL